MKVNVISKADFVRMLHDVDTNPTGWDARHTLPVLVDFYAEWCGPCKALSPHLEALAAEYDGQIEVYKVNIDNDEELTALYNIRTVPTLLFARPTDNKPTTMLGVMGRAELKEKIEQLLLK